MAKTTQDYWYYLPEHECGPYKLKQRGGATELHTDWGWEMFAQDCAEEFWREHDGWDYRWPIIFSFHESEDVSVEFCRYDVDMEQVPRFRAGKAKKRDE